MSLPVVRRFIKRVEERALGIKVRAWCSVGSHGMHDIKDIWVSGIGPVKVRRWGQRSLLVGA